MFARTSENFLQGMPKSPVHNVIIDFAHRGNIVRSNCRDRSNPKDNTAFIFWVWLEPESIGFSNKANASLIASDPIVTAEHFTHRNEASSSIRHMEHLGEFDNFLNPSIVV